MSEDTRRLRLDIEIARAERSYTRLRRTVAGWLERRHIRPTVREYLLLLPDLFALLIRLLRDPRLNSGLKLQLLGASAYVIAPIDLIPDFIVPLGLTDDTVVLAFVLSRVVGLMGGAGERVLREHWEGRGDVLHQIQMVLSAADHVLNRRILGRLSRRFGRSREYEREYELPESTGSDEA